MQLIPYGQQRVWQGLTSTRRSHVLRQWSGVLMAWMLALGVPLPASAESSETLRSITNRYRVAAGMIPLGASEALRQSAENHAQYLHTNTSPGVETNISSHDEIPRLPYFTGRTPADRALEAGYPHRAVTENVSSGNLTGEDSVSGLMSAIYHRLGFLDFDVDSLGAARVGRHFVYNMGQTNLARTCAVPPPESKPQAAFDCYGVLLKTSVIEALCASPPAAGVFEPAISCPDGTRIRQSAINDLCMAPPAGARFGGSGSYYQFCENGTRIDKPWFDAFCSQPPANASAPYSGRYVSLCDDKLRVYAEWLQAYCQELPASARFTETGRFVEPCVEQGVKIKIEYFDQLLDTVRAQNPEFVIWPAPNQRNIPPAFYEEIPDPLPDLSLSGYPVSLQFNPAQVAEARVLSFTLEHQSETGDWQQVPYIRAIDARTDVHQKLSPLEFAWFPLQRLEWGARYRARIQVLVDGSLRTIETQFGTPVPTQPIRQIGAHHSEALVEEGVWTILYYPPDAAATLPFSETQYRFFPGTEIERKLIDANTLMIKLNHTRCRPVTMTLVSGQEVKLKSCR